MLFVNLIENYLIKHIMFFLDHRIRIRIKYTFLNKFTLKESFFLKNRKLCRLKILQIYVEIQNRKKKFKEEVL